MTELNTKLQEKITARSNERRSSIDKPNKYKKKNNKPVHVHGTGGMRHAA